MSTPGSLQAVPAYAELQFPSGTQTAHMTLSYNRADATGPSKDNVAPAAAVPGAFVIVADDYPYLPTAPAMASFALPVAAGGVSVGQVNGHIFRLGQPVPANASAVPPVPPGTFEVDPQYGMRPIATTGLSPDRLPLPFAAPTAADPFLDQPHARVYVVGGAGIDPNNTAAGATGSAEAVGVFTTLFPIQ